MVQSGSLPIHNHESDCHIESGKAACPDLKPIHRNFLQ